MPSPLFSTSTVVVLLLVCFCVLYSLHIVLDGEGARHTQAQLRQGLGHQIAVECSYFSMLERVGNPCGETHTHAAYSIPGTTKFVGANTAVLLFIHMGFPHFQISEVEKLKTSNRCFGNRGINNSLIQ